MTTDSASNAQPPCASLPPSVVRQLAAIRLLATDVDGTLTDGGVYLGEGGEVVKRYDCHDGYGIALARQNGLRVAFVTGRDSPVVARRAAELKVTDLYLGCHDKLAALRQLAAKHELDLEQIAFVGDDLPDAAVFAHVGAGIAVANATAETKSRADVVTRRRGGEGALREVVELLFRCQGKWDLVVADALEGRGP
ncbi:MAG: HAD hydrolase family protein [Armatimonadetes bacterium]|nr:HAD hydrolase family protein [Armatimonadota bacterium]NCQ32619.1 HAD hydrolase family protein [Armatimonadota bacterium]